MSSTASDPARGETVLLIHGMWMTPLSWEHWTSRYTGHGHNVIAPAWPGLEAEPEQLRRDPSPLRNLDIRDVIAHYEEDHRWARPPPNHHRPFLRRPVHAAAARSRPRRRGRRIGNGCAQGRPAATAVHASGRLAGLGQAHESEEGSSLDAQAIPLVLHERAHPGRVGRCLRALLHPGLGAAVLPGRFCEFQPEGRHEGRLHEPGAAAAAPRHRYRRPHLPAVGEKANFKKQRHAPSATEHKEYPGRCHFPGQDGWEEVADFVLSWATEHSARGA